MPLNYESAKQLLESVFVQSESGVAGGICINPYNIYFGKTHPDGTLTRVARIVCGGCRGPREAIRSMDYVENQTLRFWLGIETIDEATLRQIFELGSKTGMGVRQDGEGCYELVTLKLVELRNG